MKRLPYIGITGFMDSREVLKVVNSICWPEDQEDIKRKLMVGVLVSSKTLAWRSNRWPNRYPKIDDVSKVFVKHEGLLNLIHYNTDYPQTLFYQLQELVEKGGDYLHGIQLNVTWPELGTLHDFRVHYPEKTIVLQIGRAALLAVDQSPEKLVQKLERYKGFVDYVLLDLSGGTGEILDSVIIKNYLCCLEPLEFDFGIGIAGGLNPNNLENLIKPFVKDFPALSIDAQGRLRDDEDHLDLAIALNYYERASEIF